MDQAVAESGQFYAQERERWRQIYLAVLGHDLRGPLNAIALSVELLRFREARPSRVTEVLTRGVKRLSSLLDSLLEYSRANFRVGMVLNRVPGDLGAACAEEIELLRVAFPAADIRYSARGNTYGAFDASRVREALANLVSHAVKHGDPPGPALVEVDGDERTVRITVENAGNIPAQEFETLFDPLYRRGLPTAAHDRTHLGLGLFIARQIAKAHNGDVTGSCLGADLLHARVAKGRDRRV